MHIEAELDERHAQLLLDLHKRVDKPIPELAAEIMARALEEATAPETKGG